MLKVLYKMFGLMHGGMLLGYAIGSCFGQPMSGMIIGSVGIQLLLFKELCESLKDW
jgi:putative effector of murein hydrolase LrgA (UPF0299 family)